MTIKERCGWAKNDLAIAYHDTEWGKPLHDDRALFELLILEVAQAGLSWDTVLAKRDNYRKAFQLIQKRFGSFNTYLWSYVDNTPVVNNWKSLNEVPASTPLSDKIAKDLKKRGFNFVGTTIVYAYMQSTGMLNDHLAACPSKFLMQPSALQTLAAK